MKFVGSQLFYYLNERKFRSNVKTLSKYLLFLLAVIAIHSVLFHLIMLHVEGKEHSWLTGVYWTLTVMSTLGFGDITFHSDIGRLFSIVVLISGIILLLIVLPFAFIRFFYAPLLERQNQMSVPREVPPETEGHVIICSYGNVAPGFVERLAQEGIPYYVIEEDPVVASGLKIEGISVLSSKVDEISTYEGANLRKSKLILVNREDTMNTKIILTIKEISQGVPIVALAEDDESVDVLELSGANHVLPIKRWLGEQLANRVSAVHAKSHPIGQYEDLLISELPVHQTALVNKTIRETRLRQLSGASIIGVWEKGRLKPARPETLLTTSSVIVVIGTGKQLSGLDQLFTAFDSNPNPVVIIGGGRVGEAAAKALKKKKIDVNLVEKDPVLCKRLKRFCNKVLIGDAADYQILKRAGILETAAVVLTTNDDAMNVFLASYCRQLNENLRIVSRITEERNIDIIHKAGADFVLSYAWLGAEAVFSILKEKKLVVLGEGVNLISTPVPESLVGKKLAETEIGSKTGLTVIALQQNGKVITQLTGETELTEGAELLMLGDAGQKKDFVEAF